MNPVGMNLSNNVDPTAAAMNADIMHNQRMADVMRMNSLQPIQNIGASPLSQISPVQALAQILQAHVGSKYQEQAHNAQTQMVEAMQEHTRQGLAKYREDFAKDPAMANINALESNSPVVRALALLRAKKDMGPVDMAKHATDASIIASNGNPAGFAAKDELTAFQPGSLLKDQQGQLRTPTAQPGAAPTVTQINGDLYHRTPTGLDLINKAPRVTTTVNNNMPAGETAFEKRFGEKEAARLSNDIEQRPMAVESINATNKGLQLLEEGIHTGIFADMQKNLAKGYGAISGKEPEKAARTEQFISHIGNLVTAGLKLFGGSDTVEEMKYLQKIMAGDITMEPTALKNVLKSLKVRFDHKLKETDSAIEAYKSRGKTLPTLDATMRQPNPDMNDNSGAVMSPEEYLKQFGM